MKGSVQMNVSNVDDELTGIEVDVQLECVNLVDKVLLIKAMLAALLADAAELEILKVVLLTDCWPDDRTLAEIISQKEATGHAN